MTAILTLHDLNLAAHYSDYLILLSDGIKINAPVSDHCPVNIECRVVDSTVTGSHEMFVGKIEYVHADSKLVDNEGNIDFSSIKFL
ncbi:flavin reductase [Petroclostridium sp. X23]|uniref:flavin reductase n=1 Tax=Petroclostridium sp. X23 TaxID=3045146 RepID=UPI0024AD90F3|nr:flavin reductase [Petroclostridium sp. X23]WHH60073.1 flavin reductase [Petroclostridium sp. X23]